MTIYIENLVVFDNFGLNSTNFWYKSNPNSKSESEFESSRQFQWISTMILDRKSRLKDDLNPISNDFKLEVDYIALAYHSVHSAH